MCYDDNARPPQPPVSGDGAHGTDLVLTASDGNRFMAYLAEPVSPSGAQVLIYPDIRGLHQFYKELALRFAEVGIRALALDYFGRTAGISSRDDSFEYWPHVQQVKMQTFFADVAASIDRLRASAQNEALFTLGFCFGGSLSLLSSREDFGQAGGVAFYAGLGRQMAGSDGTVQDLARSIRHPVLGLFGGADQGIPTESVKQLDLDLDQAGVEHEVVIYPGAPHSFFDRKATEFADASTDAWKRLLNFIDAHKR
ncbi:MAG: dienelactone hydrolase family protein [Ktedonobacteraceae bacterium]|nr:dienelactone hydrolase family protein [Ktedonobacteraceae bacterium]